MRFVIISLFFFVFLLTAQGQSRTIGVVTLENYQEGDSLSFLNADGTVWLKYDPFFQDLSEESNQPVGLKPLSLFPDYFLVHLRCMSLQDSIATVIVDEGNKVSKLVDTNGRTLKFQSWSVFLMQLSGIGIMERTPAFRAGPDSSESVIPVSEYEAFEMHWPTEIKGDWMRVDWGDWGEEESKGHGWVPWRNEKDELLIELYSIA